MARMISILLVALLTTGCGGAGVALTQSPVEYGWKIHLSPEVYASWAEDDEEEAPADYDPSLTFHPALGLGGGFGSTLLSLGGQARWHQLDSPLWIGGEGSLVRLGGTNGFSVGALGGYDLPLELSTPVSAFAYLGYLNVRSSGFEGRLGLEVKPRQLLEKWEDLIR